MHAKLRYSAVLAFLICLCLLYLLAKHASAPQHRKARRSYLGGRPGPDESGILSNNVVVAALPPPRPLNSTLCTMASCFDFSLCEGRPFRLYVYPLEDAVCTSYMIIPTISLMPFRLYVYPLEDAVTLFNKSTNAKTFVINVCVMYEFPPDNVIFTQPHLSEILSWQFNFY